MPSRKDKQSIYDNKQEHSPQPFEKTPIYKIAREVLVDTQKIVARMKQKQKYITGQELSKVCARLMECICYAYMEQELKKKIAYLKAVQKKATGALVWYRIANDLHLVSRDMYCAQLDRLVSIIKQATGWLNKVLPQEVAS